MRIINKHYAQLLAGYDRILEFSQQFEETWSDQYQAWEREYQQKLGAYNKTTKRRNILEHLTNLGLTLVLSACTVATNLPAPVPSTTQTTTAATATPIATATAAASPTPTPAPTATPTLTSIPSPTSFAGLSAPRPWLILSQDDGEPLLVYPPDHTPIRLVLPNGGRVSSMQEAVSPDGRWIAFFTGYDLGPKPDLTLNLLDLANGSVQPITPVLAEGFPENMRPLAEHMVQITPLNPDGPLSVKGWMQLLENIFPEAVMAVAWSPDSRSLAFSAQIDGPSADVYVYHLDTGKIQRMEADIYTAYRVEWSPDGKWILYSNDIPGPIYSARTLSAIRADGPLVRQPKYVKNAIFWSANGWLTGSQYLISGQGDGGDPYGLQVFNAATGTLTDIWQDTYLTYAYDPGRQTLFVCGSIKPKSEEEQPKSDLFSIRLNGQRSQTGEPCFATAEYVGWETTRFIGIGPDGVVAIDRNGNMTPFNEQAQGRISVSPDRKWVALLSEKEIALFQEPGQLTRTIPLNGISAILWSPDSGGLWIAAEDNYFLSIPDGEPEKVACPLAKCQLSEHTYVWLP